MFNIIAVKTAVLISVISVFASALLIVCFRYLGKKYNQVDKMKRDTKIAIIALIVILVATWVLSGCFTKSETATETPEASEAELTKNEATAEENFDAPAACEAAIAEAEKEIYRKLDFIEEEQQQVLAAPKLEEIKKLKTSNLSEAELTEKLTEIEEYVNDVTLISGEGFIPANLAELEASEYWQKTLALANPKRGNCPLVLAHLVALPERWGTYDFAIDGWTVGEGKEFAASENELAEKFASNRELYQSTFEELTNLNLEIKEVNGTYIVLDEVQGNKATNLGKEGKGDFVEIYRKDKLGNETLFSRLYEACGNNAEKASTPATIKKTDSTPTPTPSPTPTPTPTPTTTYTFKLMYDANGGKNPPVSETKTSTSSATMNFKLSSDKPTRSGYVFKGWSLEKVTPSKWSSAKIITEASVEANKTVTVYAVWKEKSSGGGNSSSGDGCPASEASKSSVAEGSTGSYTENANKDAGKTGIDTGKNGPSDPGSGAGAPTGGHEEDALDTVRVEEHNPENTSDLEL